jgi:hypothetical protein
MSYLALSTALSTTTATLGTLLGIITAGLMFTQGKFSELTSRLTEMSPDYLGKVLSLEKMQSTGAHLLGLRKAFTQLEASTTIDKERSLYGRIIRKTSLMNFASPSARHRVAMADWAWDWRSAGI